MDTVAEVNLHGEIRAEPGERSLDDKPVLYLFGQEDLSSDAVNTDEGNSMIINRHFLEE